MRDALGVKAGDRIRYAISEDRVQVFKVPSEKANSDNPALREALDAAEKVMYDHAPVKAQMNIGQLDLVYQKSNNASALYSPTLGRYG